MCLMWCEGVMCEIVCHGVIDGYDVVFQGHVGVMKGCKVRLCCHDGV